jgi:hypothetical protein
MGKGLRIPRPTFAGYMAIGEWLKANPDVVAGQYVSMFVAKISDAVGFEVTEASVRHVMNAMGIVGYRGRAADAERHQATLADLTRRIERIESILRIKAD